eukprot:631885-Pleurochrysis_carterae.AAC.2
MSNDWLRSSFLYGLRTLTNRMASKSARAFGCTRNYESAFPVDPRQWRTNQFNATMRLGKPGGFVKGDQDECEV